MTPLAMTLVRSERVEEWPRSLAFLPDGSSVVVGDAAGDLTTIPLDAGTAVARQQVHHAPVCDLKVAHDGAVVTSGEDGAVVLARPGGTDEPEVLSPAGRTWTEAVAMSPDGGRVAVVRGRRLLLIDLGERRCVEGDLLPSTPGGIAFSRNGQRVAAAHNGGVSLLDARVGNVARAFRWDTAMLNVAWRPDGSVIACGCQDRTLHFWRLPSGQDSIMQGFPAKPASLSWSADGRLLATSGAESALVWHFEGDGPEGKAPTLLEGHEDLVQLVSFSAQGEVVATADRVGCVLLHDPRVAETGPLGRVDLDGEVTALAWHPGGTLLATADETGRISIHDVQVQS